MLVEPTMAYVEGYYAARQRMDRSKNPYAAWNPESTEWYKGYDAKINEDNPPIDYSLDLIWDL